MSVRLSLTMTETTHPVPVQVSHDHEPERNAAWVGIGKTVDGACATTEGALTPMK